MSFSLLNSTRPVKVIVQLHADCSERVRSHVGYPRENRSTIVPVLSQFSADVFLPSAQAAWRELAQMESFQALLEFERQPSSPYGSLTHIRIPTSAHTPASVVFAGVLGYLGVGACWKLHAGAAASWTESDLLQAGLSLSGFLDIACPEIEDLQLDLYISDEAVREHSYGPELPWIIDLQEPLSSTSEQDDQDPTFDGKDNLGKFPTFQAESGRLAFWPTCALDSSADVWDQAHLIPKTVSTHAFKTAIAAIWRCYGNVKDHLSPRASALYNRSQALMKGLSASDDPQVLSNALHSHRTLLSRRENNMLPLQPHLHRLFDKLEFYVCPLSQRPVWLGAGRMPTSLLLSVAMGYEDLPLAGLLRKHPIAPAMSVNASFVLLSALGTDDLKDRLKERASKIIMWRMATRPRAVKRAKHLREDSDDEDDGDKDTKQPRTSQAAPGIAPPKTDAETSKPTDEQPAGGKSGGGAQDEGPRTPRPAPDADMLSMLSPPSSKKSDGSGSTSWAGGASSPSASTKPSSTGTAYGAPRGKSAPKVASSQQGTASKTANLATEAAAQRAVRSRTPSDESATSDGGDAFDGWWIRRGGEPKQRDVRRAVVELKTFSCFVESIKECRRSPAQVFDYVRSRIQQALKVPARGRRTHDDDDSSGSEEEDRSEEMLVREKASARILEIVGLDRRGKDTNASLLNADTFADLSVCHDWECFLTWWPVSMAGETAALDPSPLLVSESQAAAS